MIGINTAQPLKTGPIRMTTADNIRLWLVGDPYMRLLTNKFLRTKGTKDEASLALWQTLQNLGITHSPEGAKITRTSVRRAVVFQEGY
jgi:hypothetical protein